jgi:hypothetical protein
MTPKKSGESPPVSPEQFPVTPPSGFQSADHSWVLQTIMELQKSMGQLTQAVTTLTQQSKEQGDKLDSISHRVYAAAVVLTVLGAITYFFLDRMWDRVLDALTRINASGS